MSKVSQINFFKFLPPQDASCLGLLLFLYLKLLDNLDISGPQENVDFILGKCLHKQVF